MNEHHGTGIAEEIKIGWEVHPQSIQPGEEAVIKIAVKDRHGIPATAFSVVHEKQMHLLAISQDLSFFQHIHPKYKGDGEFEVNTRFPNPGIYKLYADFMPEDGTQKLATYEVTIQGTVHDKEIYPDREWKKGINGLEFELKFGSLAANEHLEMAFTIRDEDTQEPIVKLEPYLGSAGHVVIVSGDLEKFLHVHPTTEETAGPMVTYMTSFPKPGIYKIWGQFKYKNELYTVPFVVDVPDK
ncbi:hypothetical protein J7E71_23280 [Mesobacillus foraminis]|uniref:hypothetical protein n=1 Tax=Mesobacillus foraminis TaxID=279826 RepID=UPI001BEB513B|nr:hypothetical protein [Mesobacillus foraminis]MBT2758798.1 hypothetical protein [Mesobacillus foraminis]